MLESLPPLSTVVKKHDLMPTKALGQNFLFDFNLIDKIVRGAGDLTDRTVIEVGPGPGGLTRSLLKTNVKKVIVIEQDERCMPALEEIKAVVGDRLEIRQGDALKIDPTSEIDGPIKIVANLPYNVSTTLLLNWLDKIEKYESLTLMFQKEVAERICAKPGNKDYGRLSVMTQWLCEAHKLFDVSPKAFIPPPKIISTVVSITPRKEPLAKANKTSLEQVTKALFGQRRKMIRKSLQQLTKDPESVLEKAELDPTMRPEQMEIEAFCRLAEIVSSVSE